METLNRIGRLRHSKPHRQRVQAIGDAKVTVAVCHARSTLFTPGEMMRDLGVWAGRNAKALPRVLHKEFWSQMGGKECFVGMEIKGDKVVLPAKHGVWDIRKATPEEAEKLKRKADDAQ